MLEAQYDSMNCAHHPPKKEKIKKQHQNTYIQKYK